MPSFRCPHCADAECLVLEARDLAGSHETVRFACEQCGRAWRLEAIAPREPSGEMPDDIRAALREALDVSRQTIDAYCHRPILRT